MKRPNISIRNQPAGVAEIKEECSSASKDWSRNNRQKKSKAEGRRKHRKLSDEAKLAKQQRSYDKQLERAAERNAREHEQLIRRIKHLLARSRREMEEAARIKVFYRPEQRPTFQEICPRSLYSREHRGLPKTPDRPGRIARDGFRNIMLKYSCRGHGRKAVETRPYREGEAADSARYINRLEALEEVEGAVLTNLASPDILAGRSLTIEQIEEVAAGFQALEVIEAAVNGHVYSHLIIPMPYELCAQGRAEALREFCMELHKRGLPFAASLHKPDPGGNQRNFHAHVVLGARPFIYDGSFAWSFDAGKAGEIIYPAGRQWLRENLAVIFNRRLAAEKVDIRYNAIAEADRIAALPAEKAKGQVITALERRDAEDRQTAKDILAGVVQRIGDVIERAISSRVTILGGQNEAQQKLKQAREDEERRSVLEAQKNAADARWRAQEDEILRSQHAQAARKQALAEKVARRRLILNQLLDRVGREDMSPPLTRIVHALQQEPQIVAMVIDQGTLNAAYNDSVLGEAFRSVTSEPASIEILKEAARQLTFDHAAVSSDWKYADIEPDGFYIEMPALTYWSSKFGRVVPAPNDHVPLVKQAELGF